MADLQVDHSLTPDRTVSPSGREATLVTENADATMIDLVDDDLDPLLADSRPVLLYFTADWCAPCRTLGPVIGDYATRHQGTVSVVRIDTERTPAVAQRFGVAALPSLLLLRAGMTHWQQIGALPGAEFGKVMDTLLDVLPGLPPPVDEPVPPPTQVEASGGATGLPDRGAAITPPPRSVRVPPWSDNRLRLVVSGRRVTPGSDVALGPDEAITVHVTSDLRRQPSCDLSPLATMTDLPIDAVWIFCSELTAEHIGVLAALPELAALNITSSRPLADKVIAAITTLSSLSVLWVAAPGFDEQRVGAALSETVVNGRWVSAALSTALTAAGKYIVPPAVPRTHAVPQIGLSGLARATVDGEPLLALLHRDSAPPPDEASDAIAGLPHDRVRVVRVPDPVDLGLAWRWGLSDRSELLLIAGARIVARRSAHDSGAVAELVSMLDLAGPLTAKATPVAGHEEPPGERTADPPADPPNELILVPPAGAQADWVTLNGSEPSVTVPAGWALLAAVASWPTDGDLLARLPTGLDMLNIGIPAEVSAEKLTDLTRLSHLRELTVYLASWRAELIGLLATLPSLRRLDVRIADPDPAPLDAIRRNLPHVVVNGTWTHPALLSTEARRS
ncbi:thioredoxin family protein [Streptomyces mirabilis]|uniref:thioredoxin family protein n=1 Tax=Streptomyces mirabilis TaxID=68239 RepID=UPI00332A4BC7